MSRTDRALDALRTIELIENIQPQADGSVLFCTGNTQVICGVSIEEKVPPFLMEKNQGWITAEYGMLPCATSSRYRREIKGQSGRTMEIQRLIGRSLRMMVDLETIGKRTLRVDCDVLNADGGTRTASITGGALAVKMAFEKLVQRGLLEEMPELMPVAAISVGMVDGQPSLDLDYLEDSSAEADANFVMAGDGRWIEIQATAEGKPYNHESFLAMADLARKGILQIFDTFWAKKTE